MLSGLTERAHLARPTINLLTHVGDVVSAITEVNAPEVIVCGHSYAGMVITCMAGQIAERVQSLVYLDAVVPEDGQSAFDVTGPEQTLRMLDMAATTGTMMAPADATFF